MKELEVVGAAIVRDGKVLAAQRSSRMKEPLKWEFAGGKPESGESHQQALRRELMEELGVKIEVHGFLAEGTYQFDDRLIRLYVYEAEIVEGLPVAKEHEQLEWVDIRKLDGRDWAPPDIPACRMLARKYAVNGKVYPGQPDC